MSRTAEGPSPSRMAGDDVPLRPRIRARFSVTSFRRSAGFEIRLARSPRGVSPHQIQPGGSSRSLSGRNAAGADLCRWRGQVAAIPVEAPGPCRGNPLSGHCITPFQNRHRRLRAGTLRAEFPVRLPKESLAVDSLPSPSSNRPADNAAQRCPRPEASGDGVCHSHGLCAARKCRRVFHKTFSRSARLDRARTAHAPTGRVKSSERQRNHGPQKTPSERNPSLPTFGSRPSRYIRDGRFNHSTCEASSVKQKPPTKRFYLLGTQHVAVFRVCEAQAMSVFGAAERPGRIRWTGYVFTSERRDPRRK